MGCKLVVFTNKNMKLDTVFRLVSKLVTIMTLNGVMTADARYLCGNRASFHRVDPNERLVMVKNCKSLTTGHYKKLRYREEHSASVVLSWCFL